MVRYIKDGAYTIIIDDEVSVKGPKEGENSNESATGGNLTSRISSGQASDVQIIEEGDDIDYANPKFILQNLNLAFPKYEDDNTYMLRSRTDVADIIAKQICFYCYCALQAFLYDEQLPIILIFGDGYIGTKVIYTLQQHECAPLIRIFCRGEFAAKEWKERGFTADFKLTRLLDGQNPAILVFCSEYSSYHMIYHLLADHNLLSEELFLVSATLGFQRKKLFNNFKTPSIFRTFVEPQLTVRSYRPDGEPIFRILRKEDIFSEDNSLNRDFLNDAPVLKPSQTEEGGQQISGKEGMNRESAKKKSEKRKGPNNNKNTTDTHLDIHQFISTPPTSETASITSLSRQLPPILESSLPGTARKDSVREMNNSHSIVPSFVHLPPIHTNNNNHTQLDGIAAISVVGAAVVNEVEKKDTKQQYNDENDNENDNNGSEDSGSEVHQVFGSNDYQSQDEQHGQEQEVRSELTFTPTHSQFSSFTPRQEEEDANEGNEQQVDRNIQAQEEANELTEGEQLVEDNIATQQQQEQQQQQEEQVAQHEEQQATMQAQEFTPLLHFQDDLEGFEEDDLESSISSTSNSLFLDDGLLLPPPNTTLSTTEQASMILAQRTHDIKNLLFLLENFYVLHQMTFEEARKLALRNLLGYVEPVHTPRRGGRNRSPSPSSPIPTMMLSSVGSMKDKRRINRRNRQTVSTLEKILLSMFTSIVTIFQAEFSHMIKISEIMELTTKENITFAKSLGIPNPDDAISIKSGTSDLPSSLRENSSYKITIDDKGKHHIIHTEKDPYAHWMHDINTIDHIFTFDDDYREENGAGFDLMRRWDTKQMKKKLMMARSNSIFEVDYIFQIIENVHAHQRGNFNDSLSTHSDTQSSLNSSSRTEGDGGGGGAANGTKMFKEFLGHMQNTSTFGRVG